MYWYNFDFCAASVAFRNNLRLNKLCQNKALGIFETDIFGIFETGIFTGRLIFPSCRPVNIVSMVHRKISAHGRRLFPFSLWMQVALFPLPSIFAPSPSPFLPLPVMKRPVKSRQWGLESSRRDARIALA